MKLNKKIIVNNNNIKIIDLSVFQNLKVFKAFNNLLEIIIGPLSPKIEVFDVFNNLLTEVPDFGFNIKEVDLSVNEIKRLPKFGYGILEYIDITKNPIVLTDEEIKTIIELNKLNDSPVIICDQIDIPQNIPHNININRSRKSSSTILSSSSELSEIDFIHSSSDEEDTSKTNKDRQLDILELLTRNKHLPHNNQSTTQLTSQSTSQSTQIAIIRSKEIYKRRTYEM
jgi:hypothetical protein